MGATVGVKMCFQTPLPVLTRHIQVTRTKLWKYLMFEAAVTFSKVEMKVAVRLGFEDTVDSNGINKFMEKSDLSPVGHPCDRALSQREGSAGDIFRVGVRISRPRINLTPSTPLPPIS